MKKGFIRAGVLTAVFVLAVLVFSILTSSRNEDMTVDMGSAALPRVYFSIDEYQINALVGYTVKMDMTAMRDTLTPLDGSGTLAMTVQAFDGEVEGYSYKLYSLDGKTKLDEKKKEKLTGDTVRISLGDALQQTKEAVLLLMLYPKDREPVYYYTRVSPANDYHIRECLDFAAQFHTEAMTKAESNSISTYLETSASADQGTLQNVTIKSTPEQVMWGDLKPELSGGIDYSIKESNEMYTSVQLTYEVKCQTAEGKENHYNVKEYFKVRDYKDKLYLLDYDRTMNQMFTGDAEAFTQKGIDLGVAPLELPYLVNETGKVVSFVQERELWNYNQDENELSLIFSFRSRENEDIRNAYDQHKIRLVSMDKNGSTTFVVYGYMNRGNHEGQVGAAIYYYNIEKNSVEEKAFIPSRQSFAIAESELGKFIYYSHDDNTLYVMIEGALYKINLKEGKQEVLVSGLREGQYAAADDGHVLAYQSRGEDGQASEISVMDFKKGEAYTVKAAAGEIIYPLGFIYEDFICGTARADEAGRTVAGEPIYPMYKLEIRRDGKNVEKTYQAEGIYVEDVRVEDNLITINRVVKNGDAYTSTTPDYITNNQEIAPSNIMLESFTSEVEMREMRLAFTKRLEETNPKVLQPKQVLFENPVTVSLDASMSAGKYYVYGLGEMLGVYDKAGYAIKKAEETKGVVVNSGQQYVWETGNRNLQYMAEGIPDTVAVQENESSMAACIRILSERAGVPVHAVTEMLQKNAAASVLGQVAGGEGLNLTGCTTEQLLYIIGKGSPVIAMTDSHTAVLLIGYDRTTVTYVNPADGSVQAVPLEEMDAMTAPSGHTYIGYLKKEI